MSDSNTPQIPAGWYADPSGAAGLRWWDGTQWTEHVSAPVEPAPAAETVPETAPEPVAEPVAEPAPVEPTPAAPVPPVEPIAPVAPVAPAAPAAAVPPIPQYGQMMPSAPQVSYAPTAAPVAPSTSVTTIFFWILVALPFLSLIGLLVWDLRAYIDASLYPDPSNPFAAFGGGYLLYTGIGWLVYAATVVLAFFDNRQLKRIGIDRPFHWAWSFLGSLVYVIGRSVVLKRRGAKGFMTPVWVYIGLVAITFIVVIVKMVDMFAYIVSVAPGYTGY